MSVMQPALKLSKMITLNELQSKAYQAGFEDYLDTPHPDKFEYPNSNCLVMTCTNGKFNGDVIDVLYNYRTGEVEKLAIYSQFKDVKPLFELKETV